MKSIFIKTFILIIFLNYNYGLALEDQHFPLDQKIELNNECFKKAHLSLEENDKDDALKVARYIDLSLIGQQKNVENDFVKLIKIFYQKGYVNESVELTRLLFDSPSIRYVRDTVRIIKLFFQEDVHDEDAIKLLEKAGFSSIDIANDRVEFLATSGRREEADVLAKALLEFWASEEFKNWNITRKKLWLADKMHSSYFYEKILNNSRGYQLTTKDFETIERFKKLKKLDSDDRNKTIVDILCRHFYIDPKLCERYDVSLETIQALTETIFNEILNTSQRSFDILHAVALAVKNTDFYFSIDILDDCQQCKHAECSRHPHGTYSSFNENVKLQWNILGTKKFKGIIIHEMTHKLMDFLYENDARPYSTRNIQAQEAYQKAVNDLELNLNSTIKFRGRYSGFTISQQKLYYSAVKSLATVRGSYEKEEFFSEYIARYPQSIANGTYRHRKVQDLMQPLANYWDEYIQPDIDHYISQNSNNDVFRCDRSEEMNYALLSQELKELKLKTLRSLKTTNSNRFCTLMKDLKKEDEKEIVDSLYKEFYEECNPLNSLWKLFPKISFSFWD